MTAILVLTRYARRGASSRVRFLNYLPRLAALGFRFEVAPLFGDGYLARLYGGAKSAAFAVPAAYAGRLAALIRRSRFDLVWIEKEALPWVPAWIERFLLRGTPYVVDLDDAWFHRYDNHRSAAVRACLGAKIDGIMGRAALVVAGNGYIAERARQAGASWVETLPTVVDTGAYAPAPPPAGAPFTVGWIGTPVTASYLHAVAPALAGVAARGGRVRLIGIGREHLPPGLPADVRPWREETEVAELQALDAGIMPLADGRWERGKCGYKLVQYLAVGRPAVASPVGVNPMLAIPGETGFLAASAAEWADALAALQGAPALRARMGAAGRDLVEREYSLDVCAPRLAEWLSRAACQATRQTGLFEVLCAVRREDRQGVDGASPSR